jgi:lipoprotein signal peptidase
VSKDQAEALTWYRKAAEQGNTKAQDFLRSLTFVDQAWFWFKVVVASILLASIVLILAVWKWEGRYGGLGKYRLILLLIVLDFATKMAAYAFLPLGDPIPTILKDVTFVLTPNQSGISAWTPSSFIGNDVLPVGYAIASWFESILIVLLVQSKYGKTVKIGLGVLAWFMMFLVVYFVSSRIHWKMNNAYLLSVIKLTSGCLLIAVIYRLFTSTYFRTCVGLLLAGAAGNMLSYFYPPFRAIDFIHSDHMQPIIRFAVFNFADLYVCSCYLMLAFSPIVLLIRRFRRKNKDLAATVSPSA